MAVGALAAFAVVTWLTAPDDVPSKGDPGFLDNLFGGRAVVAAWRVALVIAAAYAVVSVAWLLANSRPLVKLGPAEVGPALERANREASQLRDTVKEIERERDDYRQRALMAWRLLEGALQQGGGIPSPPKTDDPGPASDQEGGSGGV